MIETAMAIAVVFLYFILGLLCLTFCMMVMLDIYRDWKRGY